MDNSDDDDDAYKTMLMTQKTDPFSVPSLWPEALRAPGYCLRSDGDGGIGSIIRAKTRSILQCP